MAPKVFFANLNSNFASSNLAIFNFFYQANKAMLVKSYLGSLFSKVWYAKVTTITCESLYSDNKDVKIIISTKFEVHIFPIPDTHLRFIHSF